jgi:hypothetical protein
LKLFLTFKMSATYNSIKSYTLETKTIKGNGNLKFQAEF